MEAPEFIIIGGKKYYLVLAQEEKQEESLIDAYTGKQEEIVEIPPKQEAITEIKKAEPKVSEYREKFKNRELSPLELMTVRKPLTNIPRQDRELDNYKFKGENLFFGEGVQEEFI